MIPISEILDTSKKELDKARIAWRNRRIYYPGITKENFMDILSIECTICLLNRGDSGHFLIDKENTDVVDQFYFYLTGSKEFKGSHSKGIMLMGPIGTGKTVLLRGFAGVIGKTVNRIFEYYNAFDLNRIIAREGTARFIQKPLFIDDLGKEQEIVKEYGTDVRPILELFAARYDNGAMTFVTTNYNLDTFSKKYGSQTVDRFNETFNFILLDGKSRRK